MIRGDMAGPRTTHLIRTLQQSPYRPELDLVVATSDGRLAAFCVCWLHRRLAFKCYAMCWSFAKIMSEKR